MLFFTTNFYPTNRYFLAGILAIPITIKDDHALYPPTDTLLTGKIPTYPTKNLTTWDSTIYKNGINHNKNNIFSIKIDIY